MTRILGMGVGLPREIVGSSCLDRRLGKPTGWISNACGVFSRSVATCEETQEHLAVIAAQMALADAGLQPDNLDLILFGAAVGRQPIPATAPLIKDLLGIRKEQVPAYDINATCLSALVAMDLANLHIGAGRAKHVLVVSSEIASRALPWDDDPATAGLFGDGAGALVLGPSVEPDRLRIRDFAMETWAEGYDFCTLGAGGTRFDLKTDRLAFEQNCMFRMDGHSLFRLSRKRLPHFIQRLLERSGWTVDDIDAVVPHQASPLALQHMIRRCGFHSDRVVNTIRDTGNLVAASLPITLHTAREDGRIQPGSKILMIGTSAGVSVAGMTLVG